MLWDSTRTSDLNYTTVVHPGRWFPITPLTNNKKSINCTKTPHDMTDIINKLRVSPGLVAMATQMFC